jgi:DNA (cytosine-5)-methyltransferase 1
MTSFQDLAHMVTVPENFALDSIGSSYPTVEQLPVTSSPELGPLTAIDLYSGIGGWALGFKMAGISVAASFERDQAACDTQLANLGGSVVQCDIRTSRISLSSRVEVVVGSPPCTQFSLSNRGGSGDIEDGVKDLDRFLSVVADFKPRFWAFENVPRVKPILEAHLYGPKGKLRKFRELFDDDGVHVKIFDMSKFGLPQRRMRCIAGRYPADLLESYSLQCESLTLADVVRTLELESVTTDPIYRNEIPRHLLTDHDFEPPLTQEEARLNRDAKLFHPIYNRMSFPDKLDKPVRAITATCTRVSRESIVIRDNNRGLRRLTLRERACLQGFPITYQFHAKSHSKRLKMIGNAIPPLFTYYIGCALRGISPSDLLPPSRATVTHRLPEKLASSTKLVVSKKRFPASRRFRATIPSLRFKSGVRFELSNSFSGNSVAWNVHFFFGTSKDIRTVLPTAQHSAILEDFLRQERLLRTVRRSLKECTPDWDGFDAGTLQARWTHRDSGLGPHAVVGTLAKCARKIARNLETIPESSLSKYVAKTLGSKMTSHENESLTINSKKLERHALAVMAGLIVAASFNSVCGIESGPS